MAEEKYRLTKAEADRVMMIPGHCKGLVIMANLDYARNRGGDRAIRQIESRLQELGYALKLSQVKPMAQYPDAVSVLIILLIKEIFSLSDKDICDMGGAAIRISPFIKVLSKYFLPLETVLKKVPGNWGKYFDFGRIEIAEHNKEKNYVVVRVHDYKLHPTTCLYHTGYFIEVARMTTGSKTIKGRETKCAHKGSPYHEHFISWK